MQKEYNYQKVIERISQLIKQAEKNDDKLSLLRLAVFILGTVISLISFFFISENSIYIPLVIFLTLFLIITHFHNKLLAEKKSLITYLKIKKDLSARKILNWKNISNFYKPDNKSELDRDLNLIGDRSLLHLLNLSKSKAAGKELLENLVSYKSSDEIIKNQNIVDELCCETRIINKLLLFSDKYKSDNFADFNEWLQEEDKKNKLGEVLFISYLLNVVFIFLSIFVFDKSYFWYTSVIYIFVYYHYSAKTKTITKKAEIILDEIKSFYPIFNFLNIVKIKKESELNKLVSIFRDKNNSLKKIFKNTKNFVSLLELKANPVIWFPVVFVFPVDIIINSKLRSYRKTLKEIYPKSVSRFNSLMSYISLAVFKLNNPEYSKPEITDDEIIFRSDEMGHPLISKKDKIANDYEIKSENNLDIITGSNMSGKSTFLRTVGVNLLLAYAGTSVNAVNLKCSNFKLFTCINVSDSVVDGISYFYSEVKRLNELLKLKSNSDMKIFLLIDEIFKGTNNKERLEGSKLFISNILSENMYGLISTHDLELGNLETVHNGIRNYHFKDSIVENKMYFDYKLHSGICPTTNALKIIKNTMNI